MNKAINLGWEIPKKTVFCSAVMIREALISSGPSIHQTGPCPGLRPATASTLLDHKKEQSEKGFHKELGSIPTHFLNCLNTKAAY